MLPFQIVNTKTLPLPSPHHDQPCGKRVTSSPRFCKNPLFFNYLHHFTNPTPINTPSPSLSPHFLLLLLLLCFLQPTEKPPRERAPSLASFVYPNSIFSTTSSPNSTTFNFPPLPCEDRPLLLDWGRVLLRWCDAKGRYPPFGLGPNFPSSSTARNLVGG